MPKKLDLKLFEKKIRLRRLRASDYEAVCALQVRCFPGMKPWKREQFDAQIKTFARGQLGIEIDKRLVASSSSLVVNFDSESAWHSWKDISGDGYLTTHDPEGDTIYGIEIMVDPDFRGFKLSRRLYDGRKKLCRDLNLERIIIGGRIPGYGERAKSLSAREYVERVMKKEIFDPVLTAQLANGFVLKGLIPEYFPTDSDSRGYATFLEWVNLDHAPRQHRAIRTEALVRICAVQWQMRTISGFKEFSDQAQYFIDVASDYRSDFVVFPELFTTQLLSCIPQSRPGTQARQLSKYTQRYIEFFASMAVKYNVNIVGGSHLVVEEGKLLNAAYLFRRDGSLERQPKIHITPSERRWWGVEPGNELRVFDTDRGRVSIQICYDIEFPELSRMAVDQGARIIFVPYNTDERHGYLRVRTCAMARCIENHVYVATSGCTGNLPFVQNADIHYAQSGIFSPSDFSFARDGVVAECTPNIEAVVVHDVDVDVLRRHRDRGTVQNWNDRRTDLYRVRTRVNGKIRDI